MVSVRKLREFFSFARPAFIKGIGRIVDPFGQLSDREFCDLSNDPYWTDYLALRSDWEAVGQDISAAIRQYSEILSKA